MVTVIADKEELTTSEHNRVNVDSNDCEQSFHYIKDYQEVDFYRTASCQPLPEDLTSIVNGQKLKSSIKGTFFVQINNFELIKQLSNNNNQVNDNNNSLLLTITDGITNVKCLADDSIPDLSLNIKTGCKLLLTGVIPIKDGLLQLTSDNTRFQYGSDTYSRPRSAYRGRRGGFHRPSHEGRRSGKTARHDHDNNETNFLKRPLPKNTLMDFMTSLKVSNDDGNDKIKDRNEHKHRHVEQHHKINNNINATNSSSTFNSNDDDNQTYNHQTDHTIAQQDLSNEYYDIEDDSSHSIYRERRNPLPPRLRRAHDERTRRNTHRSDINGNYQNGTINNHLSSSSSSYSRNINQTSFIQNNPANVQQHPASLNPYMPLLTTMNGSPQTHPTYFPTNTNPLTYSLPHIQNSPYHSQPGSIIPSYIHEHYSCCYGAPYANPTYIHSTMGNEENETKTVTESERDDNNNDNTSQCLSNDEKECLATVSNDKSNNSQETNDEKQRNSNSNSRIRWKSGDVCLARWSEDQEFYLATIERDQHPFYKVVFHDYNNRDQIHYDDLKSLPQDQQYYSYIPPMTTTSSDLNMFVTNSYFTTRSNYYSQTPDGCIIMPEAPPFPFNSAGTLYIYPPPLPTVSRSTHYNTNDLIGFQQIDNLDETINSSSNSNKHSTDGSINDSTAKSEIQSFSIPDAHLTLVNENNEHPNRLVEDTSNSKSDENETKDKEDKQEQNSATDLN